MKTLQFLIENDSNLIKSHSTSFAGLETTISINLLKERESSRWNMLNCNEGHFALYIDAVHQDDIKYLIRYTEKNFSGFYYYLTEISEKKNLVSTSNKIGRCEYKIGIIDNEAILDYEIKKNNSTCLLCLFIRKDILDSYLIQNSLHSISIKNTSNKLKKNIHFSIMNTREYYYLSELRNLKSRGDIFDLSLRSTCYLLLSELITKLEKNAFEDTSSSSNLFLQKIITIELFLLENIDKPFPGIKLLAEKAGMSESNFKKNYKIITGKTPYDFYIANKLDRAKEYLEKGQQSIKQVATVLGFSNSSYFIKKFRSIYGVSPKNYINR
ncbi:AraC family transcriptional regulator [Flavobacterium sp.]|uniref:helix-turn-helix domain-containing protein n=1 Tax=Flavobacterium sp. TaxID=239 RepID=UPI002627876A|nr:AraC family transcriptional regulator [Flavobacterium sp.]